MGSRNRDTPIQILTQVLVVWPQGGLLYLLELVDSWSENWEQEPDFRRRQWQAAASSSWKQDLRSWTGSPYHWTTGVGSYVWVSSSCLLCQKQMQVRRSSEGKELSRKFIKKKIILQKDRQTQRERRWLPGPARKREWKLLFNGYEVSVWEGSLQISIIPHT